MVQSTLNMEEREMCTDVASDNESYVASPPILDGQAEQPPPDTNDSRCHTEILF